MRKHLLSVASILAMIFLAFGSTDTNTSNSPSSAPGSSSRETAQKRGSSSRETAQKRPKENLDQFMACLSSAGIDNSVIYSVSVKDDTATITVTNAWHLTAHQIRLQAAQNLWKIWAAIASPAEPDKARIELVDFNGNEVGGSRIWGGSLLWVQED